MSGEQFCVIGCGGLGSALVKGLLQTDPDQNLLVIDRNPEKIKAVESDLGRSIASSSSVRDARNAGVVVMAVKPQVTTGLLNELVENGVEGTLYISVAAGLDFQTLERVAPRAALVRSMPNTGSAVGAGTTAVMLGPNVDRARDQPRLELLFQSVGQMLVLTKESDFHAATALSGSGPAFVLMAMEAMEDAGVRSGLPRNQAAFFSRGAFRAALKLSEDTGLDPARLRAQITSPGGTTIAGLAALERSGLRAALMDGVQAAEIRSREMESENQKKQTVKV